MISSHTIKSKNIVVKKREREKTVSTVAEYQAACSYRHFSERAGQNALKNKLMPIKKMVP